MQFRCEYFFQTISPTPRWNSPKCSLSLGGMGFRQIPDDDDSPPQTVKVDAESSSPLHSPQPAYLGRSPDRAQPPVASNGVSSY